MSAGKGLLCGLFILASGASCAWLADSLENDPQTTVVAGAAGGFYAADFLLCIYRRRPQPPDPT